MDSNQIKDLINRQRQRLGAAQSGSVVGRVSREVQGFHWFFLQVGIALYWIYDTLVYPLIQPFWAVVKWLVWEYRVLWERTVFVNDEFGVRHFSKVRGGLMVLMTAAVIWFTPVTFDFGFDTGLYFTTAHRNEVVYLTNAQEIDPASNTHSVQGCHQLPCNDQDSIYYRVRATGFNEVWSILHHGTFFFSDYVAAGVPAGTITKCTITSYGIRVKLFMRGLDLYPDLLTLECTPNLDTKGG